MAPGVVNDVDLKLTLSAIGYMESRFDLNTDGFVDYIDVALVLDAYNKPVETKK